MRRLLLLALVFMPCLAKSQDLIYEIEGDYSGQTLYLRTIADSLNDIVIAKVQVATTNCTGEFVGAGNLEGSTLQLVPYEKINKDDQCVISLTFDKTGKKAKLRETANCSYHGATCTFNGEVAKKR